MPRNAVVVRNVHLEDLGAFESVLIEAGYGIRILDVGIDDLDGIDPIEPDLLILLGGPLSVYDVTAYPFLEQVLAVLRARLPRQRPTFGICLGAQEIATALGAKVQPMGYKEICFEPLMLTGEGAAGPLARLAGVPIGHWHGDIFAIPKGAVRLAATPACGNQAFAVGHNILGIQFHAEVDPLRHFERRLIGHAVELNAAGIDVAALRQRAAEVGAAHVKASQAMFGAWLNGLRW